MDTATVACMAFVQSGQPLHINKTSTNVPPQLCKMRMISSNNGAQKWTRREALIQGGHIAMLTLLSPVMNAVSAIASDNDQQYSAAVALAPLVNLRVSLSQLRTDIEGGTNGDLRRIVRTIQKGIDIPTIVRRAASSAKLSKSDTETFRIHTREAAEFIDQIIEYYDPTAVKQRPPAEMLQFSLNALQSAAGQLDQAFAVFSHDVVQQATKIVQDGLIT